MAQIITQQWGGGWGGWGWTSYTAGNWINIENDEISVDESVVQTTDNLVTNLTNPDDTHYPSAKAVSDAITSSGGWDMLKSVYDPNNVNADAFDYCNFTNTPTIPTDNCQLSNSCGYITSAALSGYAQTCDIPTDNCQLANSCGYTTCTWTLTASNISNTAYGSSWSWETTVAPSKNAVYAKVSSIDALIPSAATCSNQLADKDYVNDSINSVTAFYITKNAAGDQFATYAELAAATVFYSWWVVRVPTRNDYAIVLDDETHDDEVTRYIYNNGWEYQYTINESPLTTAQINALNSWITATKVSCYDCCMAKCCDIPTNNCQLSNGCGYVTSASIPTDNCQLANWCGYTTCTWTLSSGDLKTVNCCSLVGSGDITINPWITKIFTLADTSDLTTAQAAYDYAINWGNPIIRVWTSTINHYWENATSSEAKFTNWHMWASGATTNWQRWQMRWYVFTLSSWTVTAVTSVVKTLFISPSAPTSWDAKSITLVV